MQDQNTKKLLEAIERFPGRLHLAVRSLDRETLEAIVIDVANRMTRRRAALGVDIRQLDLPGFEHVNVTEGETLDQYRAETARLEKRIKYYDYARRSTQNLRRDKLALRERKKLDGKIARFFANDPDMTVPKASELYRAEMETAAAQQRQAAIKQAIKHRHKSLPH
jgi:hypothetical protein